MPTNIDTSAAERRPKHYTSEEYAALIRSTSHAVRASYSRNGHHQNLVPLKLPNGQLLWDADEVDALLRGEFSSPTASPDAEQLGKECGAVLMASLTSCASPTEAVPIVADFLVALGEERTTRYRKGAAIGIAGVLAEVLMAGLAAKQEGTTPYP